MEQFTAGQPASGSSSTGLDPKLAGLLCYLLAWVTGLIFILLEKDSKFVRFHALQSIFFFGGLTALSFVFSILGYLLGWMAVFAWLIGFVLAPILWVLVFVLWIVLMVKAFQGEMWRLPVVGEMAARYA